MAENTEFSAKLKEIAEQNTPLPAGDDPFMKELSESATALDSLDINNLRNLQGLVSQLPDSSPYKTILNGRISDKLDQLQKEGAPAVTAEMSAAPKEDFTDFVVKPSYSVAARHKELSEKGDLATPEELAEKEHLEAMAKEALKLSSPQAISIENAVSLKDYYEIAANSPNLTEEEKANLAEFEPQIEKALAEFDKLNDLDSFKDLNPDDMDNNEAAWLQKSREFFSDRINADNEETFDILSHLAAQKLKHTAPGDDAKDVIGHEMDDLQGQFAETVRNEVINQGATNKFKAETGLSDEEIAALKISGDKGMLDSEEERKKYEALIKIREEYLKKYADADIGTVAAAVASEEIALEDPEKARKLAAIHAKTINNQPLTAEEQEIFAEFGKRTQQKINVATEATQVAYVKDIDALASRTARVTGAKDVTNETKGFIDEFAKKHPKLYTYGKCVTLGGSKAALGWVIGEIAGVNGLAAYSAYNTYNTYKKAYKKFQEETGQKGFRNFIKYLKKEENADERINLLRSIASTSIAATFAVVGNATGLAYIPGAKAVANTAVNLTANTAKFFHKLKSYTKNKDGKTKKGLIIAAAGLAVTGTLAAVQHFLPDETKEKLGNWVKGLFGGNGDEPSPETPQDPAVDNSAPASSGKPFDLEEAQQKLRDAAKLDPETESILNQKFSDNQFGGLGNGGSNIVNGGQGGGDTSGGGDTNGDGTDNEITDNEAPLAPEPIQADGVAYTFDQRKGLFISNTGGVGIHHADTMARGSDDQLFEGGETMLPAREAGELEAAYNERVIATVNADIAQKAELGTNYHAKLTISKEDGSTIDVKQHTSVRETNEETLTKVRRKIRTEDDTYTQKIDKHVDKATNQSYTMTKYRSHQVESSMVGGDGGKEDKILRAATVGDKKYEIVRDGDSGKKFIVESQRNEHGVYERVSTERTTMGDKKTLETMINKEMGSRNAGTPAAELTPPTMAQNINPPDQKIITLSAADIAALRQNEYKA